MKKVLFMAALAAAALSSCSNEEIMEQGAQASQGSIEDGAVMFSAYSARTTRATVTDLATLQGAGSTDGFGVFAYDQDKKDYANYSASSTQPNFMYNQRVHWNTNAWEYSPVKYYNNNEGAKHSFFAYAPWDASVKAVFSSGKNPQIRYTANDDIDLLWGCEWKTDGAAATTAPMNKPKPGVTDKIGFNFKHALSKVTVKVVPFVDNVHGDSDDPTLHPEHTATGKLATGTTVTLRSIKFEGANMPSKGLLDLGNGNWTIEETDENAYEMATSLEWVGDGSTTLVAKAVPTLTDKMIIPTGDKKFKIKVVYDVTTTDASNPKNNSTITNSIASEEIFSLAAGTAYEYHLDLGLTSVKFDAKVVDWTINQDVDVDLPVNALEAVSATPFTSKPAANANFKGESVTAPAASTYSAGDLYYNTTDQKMYVCYDNSGTNDWKVSDTPAIILNKSVIYNVPGTDNATTRTEAPRFIIVTSDYYMLVNGDYGSALTKDLDTYNSKTLGEFIVANPVTGIYKIAGTVYYYVHQ